MDIIAFMSICVKLAVIIILTGYIYMQYNFIKLSPTQLNWLFPKKVDGNPLGEAAISETSDGE
jgi:hypothetical protein